MGGSVSFLTSVELNATDPRVNLDIVFPFLTTVRFLIWPIIVVTNLVVILAPVFTKRLRTNENVLLAHLATADFLHGVLAMPTYLLLYGLPGRRGIEMLWGTHGSCLIYDIVSISPQYLSFNMLVLLCVDRTVAINFPGMYGRRVHKTETNVLVSFVWLVAAGISVGFVVCFEYDAGLPLLARCNYFVNVPLLFRQGYKVYFGLSLMAAVMMCFQNVCKIRQQKQVSSKRNDNISKSSNVSDTNRNKKNIALFKIAPTLVFFFILVWTPTFFLNLISQQPMTLEQFVTVNVFMAVLRDVNSAVNVFIYAWYLPLNRAVYVFMLTNRPTRWKDVEEKAELQTVSETAYVDPLRNKSGWVKQRLSERVQKQEELGEVNEGQDEPPQDVNPTIADTTTTTTAVTVVTSEVES